MNKIYIIIGIVFLLAVAFCAGRMSVEGETTVEYVKGQTASGSINPKQFIPVLEKKPNVSIQYRDTGSIKYRDIPADTAGIIADYEMKRKYALTAFDDKTKGKLELFPTIQYNRLTGLDYDFTPIIEKNYTRIERVWQPFVSGSYSTLGYTGFGGGVFYHNLGIQYQYQYDLKNRIYGHMLGGMLKF
jgi:hypothetical protein